MDCAASSRSVGIRGLDPGAPGRPRRGDSIAEEANAEKSITNGTLLDAHKGEQIGVLSVRGAYSRCVRLSADLAGGKLALRNGVVPTDKLEFLH